MIKIFKVVQQYIEYVFNYNKNKKKLNIVEKFFRITDGDEPSIIIDRKKYKIRKTMMVRIVKDDSAEKYPLPEGVVLRKLHEDAAKQLIPFLEYNKEKEGAFVRYTFRMIIGELDKEE